jgi:hypothetical protein
MSSQTNGPYHWGNGPKPKKAKKKGCGMMVLALMSVPGAAVWGAIETVRHFI